MRIVANSRVNAMDNAHLDVVRIVEEELALVRATQLPDRRLANQ